MAIYDFSKAEESEVKTSALTQRCHADEEGSSAGSGNEVFQTKEKKRDRIFSAMAARLFFLLLVAADLLWIGYALVLLAISVVGFSFTGGRVPYFKNLSEKAWVVLRRSLVCGISLIIALFSPAFVIMIACTYFLLYDKTGIEEVVPSSLRSQF